MQLQIQHYILFNVSIRTPHPLPFPPVRCRMIPAVHKNTHRRVLSFKSAFRKHTYYTLNTDACFDPDPFKSDCCTDLSASVIEFCCGKKRCESCRIAAVHLTYPVYHAVFSLSTPNHLNLPAFFCRIWQKTVLLCLRCAFFRTEIIFSCLRHIFAVFCLTTLFYIRTLPSVRTYDSESEYICFSVFRRAKYACKPFTAMV